MAKNGNDYFKNLVDLEVIKIRGKKAFCYWKKKIIS